MKVFSLIQQAVTRYRKAIAKVRGLGRTGLRGWGREKGGGGEGGGRGGGGRRRDQYGASWKGEEGDGGRRGKGKCGGRARASRAPPAPSCGRQSSPRGPGRWGWRGRSPGGARRTPRLFPGRAQAASPSGLRPRGGRRPQEPLRSLLGAEPEPSPPERGRSLAGRLSPGCRRWKSSLRPFPAPRPRGKGWGKGTFLVGGEFIPHTVESGAFVLQHCLRPGRGRSRSHEPVPPGRPRAGPPRRGSGAAGGGQSPAAPRGTPAPMGSRTLVGDGISVLGRLPCKTPLKGTTLKSVTELKVFLPRTSAYTYLELVPYGAEAAELGPDFGVE